jgi:hypothetical protein
MPSISASVGLLGTNQPDDVKTVKSMLVDFISKTPALNGVTPPTVDTTADQTLFDAIKAVQTKVLHWSGRAVDGKIDVGGRTWRKINGNVNQISDIKPGEVPRAKSYMEYSLFRQGDYSDVIGDAESGRTIAGIGCLLTCLCMAASYVGARTTHWPTSVTPEGLSPPVGNTILKSAGAFNGQNIIGARAARALGMDSVMFGRDDSTGLYWDPDADCFALLAAHVRSGLPAILHVDYYSTYTYKKVKDPKSGKMVDARDKLGNKIVDKVVQSSEGDHWILLVECAAGNIFTALDPAYGDKMTLGPSYDPAVNTRAALHQTERPGFLYGASGSQAQRNYVGVKWRLLYPAEGSRYNLKMAL